MDMAVGLLVETEWCRVPLTTSVQRHSATNNRKVCPIHGRLYGLVTFYQHFQQT
jgi:hypothetical protein